MTQADRIKKITGIIETARLHVLVRHEPTRSLVGIPVNDERTVWEAMPDDPSEDEAFAARLIKKARTEASRP